MTNRHSYCDTIQNQQQLRKTAVLVLSFYMTGPRVVDAMTGVSVCKTVILFVTAVFIGACVHKDVSESATDLLETIYEMLIAVDAGNEQGGHESWSTHRIRGHTIRIENEEMEVCEFTPVAKDELDSTINYRQTIPSRGTAIRHSPESQMLEHHSYITADPREQCLSRTSLGGVRLPNGSPILRW